MICPKCREEIADHSQTCPLCGAEIFSPDHRPLKTSGLAIASLVLSLTCVFAIVALPMAIAAQIQISRRKYELTGSGLAIAAMCISGVCLFLLLPFLAAMMLPVFFRGNAAAQKATCLANTKNISLALQMYATDYGVFPGNAQQWQDSLQGYIKNEKIYTCPTRPKERSGFAYMSDLAGRDPNQLADPATQIAVFESDQGWDAAGGLNLMPTQARHMGGDNFGYADGHAKWRPRKGLPNGSTVPGGRN